MPFRGFFCVQWLFKKRLAGSILADLFLLRRIMEKEQGAKVATIGKGEITWD